jgi:hypothetical protein
MVEMLGHSRTKERVNREHKLRPKPARQSSTLPVRGSGCNSPDLLGNVVVKRRGLTASSEVQGDERK